MSGSKRAASLYTQYGMAEMSQSVISLAIWHPADIAVWFNQKSNDNMELTGATGQRLVCNSPRVFARL